MSNPVTEFFNDVAEAITPKVRRTVYRLVSAVLLVLAMHQVVDAETVTGYLQALALFLGIAPAELAQRNTPR